MLKIVKLFRLFIYLSLDIHIEYAGRLRSRYMVVSENWFPISLQQQWSATRTDTTTK